MGTRLSSGEHEIIIGPDHPFALIGERINPAFRRGLAEELIAGSFDLVQQEAAAQVEAGAVMLDVHAIIPDADEAELLSGMLRHIQAVVDVPLCITASTTTVLDAALTSYKGKGLVNALPGDVATLERFLPVVAQHGAACVIMCSGEDGIPDTVKPRVALAARAVDLAQKHGMQAADVIIDPVIMPIGARRSVGQTVLETLDAIHSEVGVNTLCGVSNISIGLPNRVTLNAGFLAMLIARGVSAAIANPLSHVMRMTALAADMFMGHDENSERWLIANRRGADLEARRIARQKERAAQRRT